MAESSLVPRLAGADIDSLTGPRPLLCVPIRLQSWQVGQRVTVGNRELAMIWFLTPRMPGGNRQLRSPKSRYLG